MVGLAREVPCLGQNGTSMWKTLYKLTNKFHQYELKFYFWARTLPGKHLEEIAEQLRIHNINALMVIGGFEVSLLHLSLFFFVNVSVKK